MAILGRSSDEIGTSFATARAVYAARISGGYKFGMILSEIGKKPSEILKRLDEQSRSNIREEAGKFELKFNTFTEETAITFSEDDMVEEPVFDQGKVFNVYNKIRATYDIDWAQSSIFTGWKFGRYKKQTTRGDGTKTLDVEFPAIQIQAMAEDVADGLLIMKLIPWPTVRLALNRKGRVLEKGDVIGIYYDFWSEFAWKVLSVPEKPTSQRFSVTAEAIGYIGALLQEDDGYLLQEDDGKILL
jgi:hypothetical protein